MDNPFVFREETLESKQDRRDVSFGSQEKFSKRDLLIARLCVEIPLCLLPVMMWINTFGFFQKGRHEQNALFAVGTPCFLLLHLLPLLAAVYSLFGVKNYTLKVYVIALEVVVYLILRGYFDSNAIAYS